jgi:hypothetical protein
MNRTLRCPTCNAEQPWSDDCRRCRCDLSLLHDTLRAAEHSYQAALRLYSEGRVAEALPAARQAYELEPQEATRRLWAVCALRTSDWPTAVRLAKLSSVAAPVADN